MWYYMRFVKIELDHSKISQYTIIWFYLLHWRELCGVQSRKLDQLEEENVRLENQLEQKQLDWETRDVELEELQVNEIIYAAETYAFK